ncbi:hypothetical protein VDA_000125 [Photobacterium damselae subsp. damselae CIP 102761]|uniref:Uncharacterized protein n=1 Tax=Photobacterium damselae subsp. damselae CIP 102761 TaxID=675817 RepID=D0Z575_PHODD|nr:hypothetical protein VDA_000034 [Photobacterium damselae subsp. damselae CIP 102761]EEZ39109.1 hypothetical protein VDA_000125 [Photobacterium damselae subsp. damselae CIP 102761]
MLISQNTRPQSPKNSSTMPKSVQFLVRVLTLSSSRKLGASSKLCAPFRVNKSSIPMN